MRTNLCTKEKENKKQRICWIVEWCTLYTVHLYLVQIHINSPSSNENNKSNGLAVISSLLSIQLSFIPHAMDYIVCDCRLCAVVYWWTYAYFHCWFNAVDRQNVFLFFVAIFSRTFFVRTFAPSTLWVELVLWWLKKIQITKLVTFSIFLKNFYVPFKEDF